MKATRRAAAGLLGPLLRVPGLPARVTDQHMASVLDAIWSDADEEVEFGDPAKPRVDFPESLKVVLEKALSLLHVEAACLFMYNGRSNLLERRAEAGFVAPLDDQEAYALGEGLTGEVFAKQEPLLVNDVGAHPRAARARIEEHAQKLRSGHIRSVLFVPLSGTYEHYGVARFVNRLGKDGDTPQDFVAADCHVAVSLGRHLEQWVSAAVAKHQSRVLLGGVGSLAAATTVDEICMAILDIGMEVMNGSAGAVYLDDPGDVRDLVEVVNRGLAHPERIHKAPLIGSITGEVFRSGTLRRVSNMQTDPATYNQVAAITEQLVTGYVVPLRGVDRVRGTMNIYYRRELQIQPMTLAAILELALLAGAELERVFSIRHASALRKRVARAGHSLRAPLGLLRTTLNRIREAVAGLDRESAADWIEIAEDHIDRVRLIAHAFLFAREGALAVRGIERGAVRLGNILETLKTHYDAERSLDERVPTVVVYDSAKHLPQIEGDEALLEVVFHNILENAFKYAWRETTIAVRGETSASQVVVTVTDEGLGVPSEFCDKVFEGFGRSEAKDRVRFIPGTGMGLTIAKELIEAHGGRIGLISEPFLKDPTRIAIYEGYRTTVTVRLPRQMTGREARGDDGNIRVGDR